MNEKEKALLETVITKRKKAEEEKKKEKAENYSKEDLEKLLVKVNASVDKQPGQPVTTFAPATQQTNKRQPTQQEQIAYSIYRDAKNTSILCLIAIVLPFIVILVTMFPGGGMFAMVIALGGIVYPCFALVKSIIVQTRAYKKYGFKPLLQLPQQQKPQQQMDNNNMNKQEIF